MCLFEEKLDDDVLEKLQDFEFAVSDNILVYQFDSIHCILASPEYAYFLVDSQFSDEDKDCKKFFYRTAKTRELDNLLGDVYHKILGK